MSEKKLFTAPRWNETGRPKVIGRLELSEEERIEAKERLRAHLLKIGVLKEQKE